MTTRTILISVAAYLPGFKAGGPVRSTANLVEHLGDEYQFRIITADRDFGETQPYRDIEPGRWYRVGKAEVCYLAPKQLRLHPLARLLRETPHDVLYLNSFLDPRFTTRPLLAQRLGLAPRSQVVLAPRGEFSSGALSLKVGKKRAYRAASGLLGLHRGLIWQASSEAEAEDIRRTMAHVASDIRIAPVLPRAAAAPRPAHADRGGGPLRIAFLGRIAPMKNLLFALKVLERVRAPVAFSIFGPREDATYWARCARAIDALPPNVSVTEHGPILAEQVHDSLAGHDLFFLPTRGENFGHVIAEALQAGLPLLISDQTPWRGLAQQGLGWDLPLSDQQAFAAAIEAVAWQSEADWQARQAAIAAYAAGLRNVDAALAANRALFEIMGASNE
ncbi:glycosyltransferase family 4 protein [Roseovarius sp. CH_XMU1461]|uniref:glycosyltransferase family 4 protein n=1 Tax=Roseovarius sp. CH_XMU1461 TaxID=3107777 RepID=UPI003009778F